MRSTYTYIQPPRWCPDAIPSVQGWKHPITGELLVSVPGGIPMVEEVIDEKIDNAVISEVETTKTVIDETVVNENPLIENDEVKEVIQEVKKPSRKKKTAQ